MAERARPKDKSKKETEKKQAETVHLSPEELRAISGGYQPPGFKPPLPQDAVQQQVKK